ncbi:YncE family protein [Polyangium aurulentum]|uniref:YncE family protein n=1 Tax=Polyangium aurulentum TaxID=2567896 RepID=UPI0010AE64A1|nr:YncE family protein [Polyangium aurulentum]UQA62246.1 YncE family protein [Polyangium aurulentum]
MKPSFTRPALATALLAALAACGEAPIEHQYDAYDGEAYPDRLTPVTVPQGGLGVVTDSLSDTLSLIDLGTGQKIGSAPVGRDPVGLDGPHHVGVDAARGFAYVALSYPIVATGGPHAGHGSSVQSGYVQKLALDDFRILGQVRVDPNPGDIVVSEDGSRVVVSHFDLQRAIQHAGNLDRARATLALVEPDALEMQGSADPPRLTTCIAPHGVALSRPDGARAYVACYGEDSIAVVDLAGRKVETRVPVDPSGGSLGDPQYGPYSAVMSPDGKTLAIGNTVSKDVRFFDTEKDAIDVTRTLKVLGAPMFAAFTADGTRLYVPTQAPDAVHFIDLTKDNAELGRRDFSADECKLPHVVERLDDTRIALVCEGDHTLPGKVLILDAETLETKSEAVVGVYPDSLARVPAKN